MKSVHFEQQKKDDFLRIIRQWKVVATGGQGHRIFSDSALRWVIYWDQARFTDFLFKYVHISRYQARQAFHF